MIFRKIYIEPAEIITLFITHDPMSFHRKLQYGEKSRHHIPAYARNERQDDYHDASVDDLNFG
ncbi:hypothetical protein ACFO1V_01710 [Daeguia caeni]|uniref:Uncharacterized protein n=1 Tax=Daeguia caeni TaxID=439612 RepID=A0ABV9H481_9HYPH